MPDPNVTALAQTIRAAFPLRYSGGGAVALDALLVLMERLQQELARTRGTENDAWSERDAAVAERDRLRETMREIAAYEDDCIHRRMAREALAVARQEQP